MGAAGAGEGIRDGPRVSVVVPVWNAEPYLRPALDSVLGQTIDRDAVEVVAVDDGSTDGSGRTLDEYAARDPRIRVFHEPNSGGPGRPRNLGLDRATGDYVFFLDADDELGPEALERLVAMADRNGSDIVLARMVGTQGRIVPTAAFREDRDRADVTEVYSTLSVLKLFRRSLIERLGLRFEEGLPGGEDTPFTARAYLAAGTISVLASYPCYYVRSRPGSQTRRGTREDMVAYLDRIERRFEIVDQGYSGPQASRDRLLIRHIQDVVRVFRWPWFDTEEGQRRRVFDRGAELIQRWHNPRIQAALPAPLAIRAHCLGHRLYRELVDIVGTPDEVAYGRPLVEGGRIFAAWPHFRDDAVIPDRAFELTSLVKVQLRLDELSLADGHLRLGGLAHLVPLGGGTALELRRWPRGPRLRLPTTPVATPEHRDRFRPYREAGFAASIDLAAAEGGAALPDGLWDLAVVVSAAGVSRRRRLRLPAGAAGTTEAGGRRVVLLAEDGFARLAVGRVSPVDRLLGVAARRSRFLRVGAPVMGIGRLLRGGKRRPWHDRGAARVTPSD